MRIRKRQVPFPLSSLSPVPLSDPRLNQSPEVQLHHQGTLHPKDQNLFLGSDASAYSFHSRPSDQPNQRVSDLRTTIGRGRNGWGCSAAGQERKEKEKRCLELQGEEVKDKRPREGEESNDIRKGSILGAEAGTGVLPPLSVSHQAAGRWCEGDKAVPLKKRRGSFERAVKEDIIIEEEKKKMKTNMKTKTNNKCVPENDDEHQQEGKETKEGTSENTSVHKKRARGGALMEGSRCSRVNGRGWRCCQQTLVGYSLCEHHLGKGRLRSMTSVRSRANMAAAAPKKNDSSSLQAKQPTKRNSLDDDDNDDEDEKKPLMITKRRMRIGMVKARSLSSLLGQTNNAVLASADNEE